MNAIIKDLIMEPINFKQKNCVYAENQPEYLPLPVHKSEDGIVTSCWKLNLKERLILFFTGRIYLQILTFNLSLQPQKLVVRNPLEEECLDVQNVEK